MKAETFVKQSEFVFIQSGNVYIVRKDSHGWLDEYFALDELTAWTFLDSVYKTTILDSKGYPIMANFQPLDLSGVQNLLSEVESEYNLRLDAIDKALAEGDKDTFMRLTNELYH